MSIFRFNFTDFQKLLKKKILPLEKRLKETTGSNLYKAARVLLSSKHDASRVLFKTVVVRQATVALRTSLTYTVRICISLPCFVHEYARVVWKHDEFVRGTIMCTKSDTERTGADKNCRLYFPRSPFVRDVREPRFHPRFLRMCRKFSASQSTLKRLFSVRLLRRVLFRDIREWRMDGIRSRNSYGKTTVVRIARWLVLPLRRNFKILKTCSIFYAL